MNLFALAAAYAATFSVLLLVDFAWLHFIMRDIFMAEVGDIALPRAKLLPAVIFYASYAGGLLLFAGIRDGDVTRAMLLGAALGFLAYGAYDLTNLATLKAWTVELAAIDMAWGTFVTALAAGAGAFTWRRAASG